MDCHGAGKGWTFNSLIHEDLDPACEYVVQNEWTEYTEFLEQGCDAALFVGMHARAGTRDGVMNHTISGRDFQNLWFNGTLVGETGINAVRAREMIEEGAKRALADLSAVPPWDPGQPAEIRVEYKNTSVPDQLRFRTGVERADDRTIVSRADSWWEAWKQFYF